MTANRRKMNNAVLQVLNSQIKSRTFDYFTHFLESITYSKLFLSERTMILQLRFLSDCGQIDIILMLQENCPVVLVYLNLRGIAQIARHLLCYLKINFVDVLIDCLEEQKKVLPRGVLDALKGVRVDTSRLPVLVHEGEVIEQLFPVLTYICYRFEREDLLGRDLLQKARVQELAQVLDCRLPQTHASLFQLVDKAATLPEQHLLPTMQAYYRQAMRSSGYMREFCELLVRQAKRQFLLGSPTLIDFYFLQSSVYMLGVFGKLQEGKRKGVRHLRVMRTYHCFMHSQDYYRANYEYLESFPVVGSRTSALRVKGINRIWACGEASLS